MRRLHRPLLWASGLGLALAGASIPWIKSLEIRNLQTSSTWILTLEGGERFVLLYEHSMYGGEVRENYRVAGPGMIVESVETVRPEIAEYYGFDGRGPVYPVGRGLSEMSLKVRASSGSQIIRGAYSVDLARIGSPGQTVRLRPTTISLLQWVGLNLMGAKRAPEMPN
jgi:hypothetical protein